MNTENIDLMDIKDFESKRYQSYIREKNFLEVKKLDADTFEVLNPAKNVSYFVRKKITDNGVVYAECSCRDFQGKGILYDPPAKCKHVWACIDFSKTNGKSQTVNDIPATDNTEDIKIEAKKDEGTVMCNKSENQNSNQKFNPEKFLIQIKKMEKGQPIYMNYLKICHRLHWCRVEHPDWTILTEVINLDTDKGIAAVKASIINSTGRVLSTGHSLEYQKNFQDYCEKAETSAIGRALATLGYGTLQCMDLDEGKLADAPVTIPEKVGSVTTQKTAPVLNIPAHANVNTSASSSPSTMKPSNGNNKNTSLPSGNGSKKYTDKADIDKNLQHYINKW